MDERVREISYRVAEELDLVDSLVKLRDKVEREARNREEIKKKSRELFMGF